MLCAPSEKVADKVNIIKRKSNLNHRPVGLVKYMEVSSPVGPFPERTRPYVPNKHMHVSQFQVLCALSEKVRARNKCY